MVRVPVRVHEVSDWLVGPTSDRVDYRTAGVRMRRIECDELVARVDQDRVAERLNHRQAIGYLRQFVRDAVDDVVGVVACGRRVEDVGGERE